MLVASVIKFKGGVVMPNFMEAGEVFVIPTVVVSFASVIEVTASLVVSDGVSEDAVVLAAVSDAGVFDPVRK